MTAMGDMQRFLIAKLSSLGDIVHALPTLCALRRSFPTRRICWLVGPKGWQVVAGHPDLDRAYVVGVEGQDSESACFVPTYPKAVGALRRERFDVALDLQGLLKSALPCFLSGARVRVGLQAAREGARLLYSRVAPDSGRDQHAVRRCLAVAHWVGAEPEPVEFRLRAHEEARSWAEQFLGEGVRYGNLVAMAPGSSRPDKCWPVESFARLAAALTTAGVTVVTVGSPGERELEQALATAAGVKFVRAAGATNVAQLIALLERCALFVGNDSGPLHIAAALGVPCLAFYGPTSPRLTGPYGDQHVLLTPPGETGDIGLISFAQAQAACMQLLRKARP
jgi:lipopolysaccharide heptosyltransferase I